MLSHLRKSSFFISSKCLHLFSILAEKTDAKARSDAEIYLNVSGSAYKINKIYHCKYLN